MAYRVIRYDPDIPQSKRSEYDRFDIWAEELQTEFGLSMYSRDEVRILWEQFSESLAASWLIPNKQDVEQVFGVVLENTDATEYR